MGKSEVIRIIECAKDENGCVPVAIVRKAIEKVTSFDPAWIPVNKDKPKDGQRIMYSTRTGYVNIGRYCANYDTLDNGYYYTQFQDVTAWCDVPKGYMCQS